jgi:nucleoside-diphosphate-sugar epimerase
MTEKALVTGGTGFVGSFLVRRLLRDGYSIRVLDNNFRGATSKIADVLTQVELVTGDICDPAVVDSATKGVDYVFHLAYINGTKYFYEIPDKILNVAVRGSLNTLDAAARHRVKRYIVASSAEVYQEPTHVPTTEKERLIIPDVKNPRSSYGGGKIVCELLTNYLAPASGLEAVIFRPHNVYGPDMGFEHVIPELITKIRRLSKEMTLTKIRLPIQGSGEETRAFCYVEDIVDGVVRCAEKGKPGETYHLGTQDEITIAQLVTKLGQTMGVTIEIEPTARLAGSTPRRCPSVQKAGDHLGYRPQVGLDEGLRRTCEWYLSQKSPQEAAL